MKDVEYKSELALQAVEVADSVCLCVVYAC